MVDERKLNELEDMINMIRELKKTNRLSTLNLKIAKEELRTYMIDSGIKEYDGVEIRRTFSWDMGIFRKDYPELYKEYVVEEVKTVTQTITDVKFPKKMKDKFKEEQTDAYREIIVENTAQIRGL